MKAFVMAPDCVHTTNAGMSQSIQEAAVDLYNRHKVFQFPGLCPPATWLRFKVIVTDGNDGLNE